MVDSKENEKFDLEVKGLNKHKVRRCETLKPFPQQIERGQGNIFLSSTSPLLIIFCSLYPLHPNISMHILHTVLYTFHKVLTRRIIQSSRTCFVGDHFLHSCDLDFWVRGDTVERNQMLITPRGQRVKRS